MTPTKKDIEKAKSIVDKGGNEPAYKNHPTQHPPEFCLNLDDGVKWQNVVGPVDLGTPITCGFNPNGTVTMCGKNDCRFCHLYIVASNIYHTAKHETQSIDGIRRIIEIVRGLVETR